jgi:hypothetical protein
MTMTIDDVIAAHAAHIPELSGGEALAVIASAEAAGDFAHLLAVLVRYLAPEDLRELLITSRGGSRRTLIEALAQYQRELDAIDGDIAATAAIHLETTTGSGSVSVTIYPPSPVGTDDLPSLIAALRPARSPWDALATAETIEAASHRRRQMVPIMRDAAMVADIDDGNAIMYGLLACAMHDGDLPHIDFSALAVCGYPSLSALTTALIVARSHGSSAAGAIEWTIESTRRHLDEVDR